MITIVSGTNRLGSNTLKVAKEYQRILAEQGVQAGLFSLEGLNVMERDTNFEKIEKEIIVPGVLKMLFDNSSSHEIWFNKEALITGNATGRAGNLRGMDHLADILNYLKITVHPNKLPLSTVNRLMDSEGKFTDAGALNAINNQLNEFLNWRQ
jgi:NAD(P)H-dependent FMN reductase